MLRYKLALINVWWDENSIDTRYFESVDDQTSYFDILTGGNWTTRLNFNMGNGISSTIVYRDMSGRSITELLHCNYLVVDELDDIDTLVIRRYYFAYPRQDDDGQLIIDIRLDTIQTYYFKNKNDIEPCNINRYHIPRFIENEDDSISFDLSPNSHLFEIDGDRMLPKRLTSRRKIDWKYTTNSTINDWLNENVMCWCYVFVDKYHNYKVQDLEAVETLVDLDSTTEKNRTELSYKFGEREFKNDYGVVSFPIMKSGSIYMSKSDKSKRILLSATGLKAFRKNNDDTSYFYGIKFSLMPPFDDISNYDIDTENNILYIYGDEYENKFLSQSGKIKSISTDQFALEAFNNRIGLLFSLYQTRFDLVSNEIELNDEFTFNKEDVVGADKNQKFNPKLLSQKYKELTIRAWDSQSFTYDIEKLGSSTLQFVYTETIQTEISRYYCRVKSPTGLYIEGNNSNYNGLVGSSDTSILFANDKYSEFLANNKNFFVMQQVGIVSNFAQSMTNSLGSSNPLASGAMNIAQGAMNVINYNINKELTIDNMKNAPHTISNASGSILFNLGIADMGIYIEIYEGLSSEIEDDFDFMYLNGFSFGHIAFIGDVDNIRKNFNYLECDVKIIKANISNIEKDDLRQRLSSIRFWNSDTIDYSKENYERGLEDET